MLKVWNVSLIVATFTLALLGTFLVRSGILESIHAFGASTVGTPLLVLIAVVIVGSAALIVSRLDDLRSERRIESLASRESVFLVNNLLLVGLVRGDLLGHVLPADLRGDHGREVVAGLAVVRPLHGAAGDPARAVHRDRPAARLAPGERGVAVAAGPGAARRRGGRDVAVVAASPTPLDHPLALVLFAFAFFALAALVAEFWRGAAAQRALSGGWLPWRARSRRRPQPAPLRRLHRPRRDSRCCSSPSPPRRASRPARTCA